MKMYIVTFSLKDEKKYDDISAQIRSYPKWAMLVYNTWLVGTDDKNTDVRTKLATSINNQGSIAVIDVTSKEWATFAIGKEVTDWMKDNI